MAKVKIDRKEIEKMLKDTLAIDNVEWDSDGGVMIEIDLDKIKVKEKEVIHEHHYKSFPIYIEPYVVKPYNPYPYWYCKTITSGNSITVPKLQYCSTKTGKMM
jgi:hypothetical protein